MERASIIDRAFLEKLERLAIHWRQSFTGLVGGHNASLYAGPGPEFLDHRRFHAGDDLRSVNWRAYLRLDKLFLKMFRIEPHTPVRLLIDTSESMNTGAAPKFDYARRLAAALAYVGLVRLDTIVIQPVSDSLRGDGFRCSGGRHRFGPAADYLTSLQAGGRTDFARTARQFVANYAQRGLLVIVSDFLDEAGCEAPIEHLADFGHELNLIHIWAVEDRSPPWEGRLELEDAETGARRELDCDAEACGRYTARFDAWTSGLRKLALRGGGRFASLATSMPVEEAVFGPLVAAGGLE